MKASAEQVLNMSSNQLRRSSHMLQKVIEDVSKLVIPIPMKCSYS